MADHLNIPLTTIPFCFFPRTQLTQMHLSLTLDKVVVQTSEEALIHS